MTTATVHSFTFYDHDNDTIVDVTTPDTPPGEDSLRFHEIAARNIGLTVSVFAIAANILVLVALGKIKSKWTPHLLLVVNLTVADLMVAALLVINRFDHLVLNDWAYKIGKKTGCIRSLFYGKGVWVGTYLTLLAIAFDHYVAILKPLHHRRLITRRRIFVAIGLIWIISVIVHFSQHFLVLGHPAFHNMGKKDYYCKVYRSTKKTLPVNDYIYVGMVAVGLCLMSFAYVAIFIETKKCLAYTMNILKSDRDKVKKNWYSALTSLLILATFLVCYLPYCVTKTMGHVSSLPDLSGFEFVHEYLANLRVVNSLCDPIIYALRLSTVKDRLGILFRKCRSPVPDRDMSLSKLRNGSSSCRTDMTDDLETN